jgi:hypothetical protein
MNENRTRGPGGSDLTQGGSRPVRYRLVSPSGSLSMGTFTTALEAATVAGQLWPGVAQRDHDNGAEGWDIEVVRD